MTKPIKKKIEDYKAGDVIRALVNDKKIKKGKKEHCFIVLDNPRSKSDKKPHIICVPACSFSSKKPKKEDLNCLDLTDYDLPNNFFDFPKETSFLRFSEPSCLEKYQIKKYINNLTTYPKLWSDICNLMNDQFFNELFLLGNACECDCLNQNQIETEYCSTDENTYETFASLIFKNEIRIYENCLVCACCESIIEKNKGVPQFKNCAICNDNNYTCYFDNVNNQKWDIPKTI